MFSCCFTSGKDDAGVASSEPGVAHNRPVQDLPIKEQAKIYVPSWQRDESAAPTTGMRKPSNAAQHKPSSTSERRKKNEVQPSDYLYFGDGTSGNYVSKPGSAQPLPHGAASSGGGSSYSGSGFASGKDNSGYTANGLNNNSQMGYSNLTYGGSLQYNFAGTQAFGAGS